MQQLRTLTSTILFLALALIAMPTVAADGVININTADQSQLVNLPRIGPALADRIVEFRQENGEFKSADDLMLVRGIGEKTFAMMQPYLAVSGKSTLTEKARATAPQSSNKSDDEPANKSSVKSAG